MDNGGDAMGIAQSVDAETQELFDCRVRELYRATGAKRNDRSTLPEIAQMVYAANESLSALELERLEGTIGGESQEEVNQRISSSVRETAKHTRKWLPW